MEPYGEETQIGPKLMVRVDIEFASLKGIPPPEDPDEQEYMAHVAFWEAILGVHPYRRSFNMRTADNVSEYHRSLVENAYKNEAKYIKETEDYFKRIMKWNETSDNDEKLSFVEILPRSPSPRCFHPWHREFRMTNTNPTSVGSMRFTQPDGNEYPSSELLQFFSLRFVGDFMHAQRMSVYGFVAVRDDVDKLRNYIFNRSREHAQEITPDSPNLLLISPTRGISAPYNVIVEYSLKVRGNGGDTKDGELIDGCFMYSESSGCDLALCQARLFGPLGPLNIRFVFMKFAVEATIVVKVKRAMPGYNLSMVTATTCGPFDEIILYDRSTPGLDPMVPKDGGALSSSMVVVAHAVVAVELGCNLKLRFGISCEEEESGRGLGRHSKNSSHDLLFTAQRHKSSKGSIVMGSMFKVATKVTWSTMGRRYLPIFDTKRAFLGDPNGPCDI